MEYKEIFKLKEMLEKAKIPFDFRNLYDGYQICYPRNDNLKEGIKTLDVITRAFNREHKKYTDLRIANEWHYPSKGEYPDENKLVLIYAKNEEGYGHDFMTYHKDNGWYGYGTYIEEVIAWKELDIPKESE